MREIAVILLLLIVSSCSALKRQSNNMILSENDRSYGNTLDRIRKQNISNQSFFISKAEVEVTSGKERQSFICNLKYSYPDKYIISLRSKSGIEGARALLTGDTVIINDRINRKLYYGRPDYIKRKFGISLNIFPVIFGDMPYKEFCDSINMKCIDDLINMNGSIMGIRYNAIADCRKAKLISWLQKNDQNSEQINLTYAKYFYSGNILVPSIINITGEDIRILIRIKKVEIPWEGNFSFIPGSDYEAIPLK